MSKPVTENAASSHLPAAKSSLVAIDRTLFDDVKVEVEARLGSAELTIQALTTLQAGSVLPLDRDIADPVDLYVNGVCVARGEIVAVGDRFGVRIVEIASS